ncbi:tRNA-2-methylthio-N(6)-dimethylallyladenosine synthase [Metallosphaera sp. J1]|uniref:B12-binding domain-containing radical SAM protein n=1 Tax=Metallosphaera javensis (ex Hofmann et al. 2022) TaxID=99938 RepID=UPI001EDCD156|nr:radical SAM protein [Metallosphaera javensis (ex Hofmann et al. 2022)]MCG3108666.1 tRNA-2-methylthio-N(6)-dimethylallyladenosine synthase [Metallosphaera javensis (ex Hofmann et al. 2022)]
MENFDFILTTDRCLMTNHHGKEFLGFLGTGPAVGVPESAWKWLACPKMKTDEIGRPWEAPYGMRKVEAKLIEEGFRAAIIDPDHLAPHLKNAKALMFSHHDYFAFGPPSSTWWGITKQEPVNYKSFQELINKPEVQEAKRRGVKMIAGGPSVWQWLWREDMIEKVGIDTLVDGEAERVIGKLAQMILDNEDLPRYMYVSGEDVPGIEDIPDIKGASVNGLIEIMRGCARSCRFCSVTLRPTRYYPLEKIERELQVNVRAGVRHGVIHSDDVLFYGAVGILPRPEPLIKLHKMVKKYYKTIAWSHASLAAIRFSEEKYGLISKLSEIIYENGSQNYLGVEVGIETGSPRLAKEIMPAKSAPYKPESYPETVAEAFKIMHEHNIIPAGTMIVGLPEEKEDDVIRTIELVDNLKPFRSILVPMFFVPMGYFKNKDWFTRIQLSPSHIELYKRVFWHDVYWAENILNSFYMKGPVYFPVRMILKLFLRVAKRRMKQVEAWLESQMKA